MNNKLHLIILLIAITSVQHLFSQKSINVPGYGELHYSEKDSIKKYSVKLNESGTFNFAGSIKPLNLETEVAVEQLSNFPGYGIIQNIGFTSAKLKIDSTGLGLVGKADTKQNLQAFCQAFGITAPFLTFTAKISSKNIKLSSEVDFSAAPVLLTVSEELGTRFTVQKIVFGAQAGIEKGSKPMISASVYKKIRPTKFDNDLQTILSVSYNLLSSEITGSASMTDTWVDPLGMSRHLKIKDDALTIHNPAFEIGWIPSVPTPTSIGFVAECLKISNFDFGVAGSIAPVSGEIALQATKPQMPVGDFLLMLNQTFGFQIPNEFPDSTYINDLKLQFSPGGASIGKYKIEQGLAMNGKIRIQQNLNGDLEFYASGTKPAYLQLNIETENLYNLIKQNIDKQKGKRKQKALSLILKKLEIKNIFVYLEADNLQNMNGTTECDILVLGKEKNLKFDFSLDPATIVKKIIENILDNAMENLEKEEKKVE